MRQRLAALPTIGQVIAQCGLNAKKSLGQHFLTDLNITDKIARAAAPSGAPREAPLLGQTVVEVGPGPGALTRSLLSAGARVIAIERDERATTALEPLVEAAQACLKLISADALSVDWHAVAPPGAILCANLPYNIATPLFTGWLEGEAWPPWWQNITVMVQREVALRMAATPDTKDYGRLAVLTHARGHPAIAFDLPPTVFVPPPKVWSSVIRFDPRADRAAFDVSALQRVTGAAFGQRRKKLRSSLRQLNVDVDALAQSAGIDLEQRAERLDVDDFLRLSVALENAQPSRGDAD